VKFGDNKTPAGFALLQNFPNPFNPETTIQFTLSVASDIEITIFNLNGAVVADLYKGKKSPGNYSLRWDAKELSAGIYFIKMQSGNFTQTRKCILLK